jgi:hypothetical protein
VKSSKHFLVLFAGVCTVVDQATDNSGIFLTVQAGVASKSSGVNIGIVLNE